MIKLMGTIRTRLKDWAVGIVFRRYYASYLQPFERAKEKVNQMPVPARTEYYRSARDILESTVYKTEFQELIRTYYQQLAIKSSGGDEATAYRLTLLALQDFDKRFHELAGQYMPPNVDNVLKRL